MANDLSRLPAAARGHVESLRDALLQAQGDNLAALLVYGSAVRGGWEEGRSDIDVVVVLHDTALPRLVACANPLLLARHRGRVEAMVLRLSEIDPASDVFPLFYDDIRSRHVLAAGQDPFGSLQISDAHRRLRIEQELREVRIRLRRAVVDAMGDEKAMAGAIDRKVKQLRGPLHALLCLRGVTCDDALPAVIAASGRAWSLDTAPLLRVTEAPPEAHAALRALLDAAIADVDRLPEAGRA